MSLKKEDILKRDPKAELRMMHSVEARADEEGKRFIEGEAAVIDKITVIGRWDPFEEVIRRGAFDNAVKGDIRIVKNHSADLVLGRSKNGEGTGNVFVNPKGNLAFSCPVRDNRSHSVDTYDEILSGDIDGCSFLFRIDEERWTWPSKENGREMPLREILSFELIYDVGPVTYPAYQETSVIARSLNEVDEYKQMQEQRLKQDQYEADQIFIELGL